MSEAFVTVPRPSRGHGPVEPEREATNPAGMVPPTDRALAVGEQPIPGAAFGLVRSLLHDVPPFKASFHEEILETSDDRDADEQDGDSDDQQQGFHGAMLPPAVDPVASPR